MYMYMYIYIYIHIHIYTYRYIPVRPAPLQQSLLRRPVLRGAHRSRLAVLVVSPGPKGAVATHLGWKYAEAQRRNLGKSGAV